MMGVCLFVVCLCTSCDSFTYLLTYLLTYLITYLYRETDEESPIISLSTKSSRIHSKCPQEIYGNTTV